MNGELIINIGTIIITLLSAIVTYIVIPLMRERTTKEQRDNLMFWARVAVKAAEQIYNEEGQGKFKKEYVINFLNGKGINITQDQIDALIEAVVFELTYIDK